jgi:hypothetical protein
MDNDNREVREEKMTKNMSKLSGALKALIDVPFARAGTTPAPRNIARVYERIGQHAESKKVERPTWLAMTVSRYQSRSRLTFDCICC